MLSVFKKRRELNFSELMAVYEAGNRENGAELFPDKSAQEQLLEAEQDFYQYLGEFFQTPNSSYYVLSEDGRYLAALRLEPYRDGLLLEALETRPEERGKGFAKLLVTLVQTSLEPEIKKVYSHISKRNQPSLAVHRACGFVEILDYAVYIDGSVNDRMNTFCWTRV